MTEVSFQDPVHRVPRNGRIFRIGPGTKPALTVPDGARCLFETADCFSGTVRSADDRFRCLEECLEKAGGLNPISGPLAVEGARAGQVLSVRIERISLADRGVVSHIPGLGMLAPGFPLVDELECDTGYAGS